MAHSINPIGRGKRASAETLQGPVAGALAEIYQPFRNAAQINDFFIPLKD